MLISDHGAILVVGCLPGLDSEARELPGARLPPLAGATPACHLDRHAGDSADRGTIVNAPVGAGFVRRARRRQRQATRCTPTTGAICGESRATTRGLRVHGPRRRTRTSPAAAARTTRWRARRLRDADGETSSASRPPPAGPSAGGAARPAPPRRSMQAAAALVGTRERRGERRSRGVHPEGSAISPNSFRIGFGPVAGRGSGRSPAFFVVKRRVDVSTIQAEIEARLASPSRRSRCCSWRSLGGHTLRLFIDHPDGVTLGLCERVTHALPELRERYALEVSSPGHRAPADQARPLPPLPRPHARACARASAHDGHRSRSPASSSAHRTTR